MHPISRFHFIPLFLASRISGLPFLHRLNTEARSIVCRGDKWIHKTGSWSAYLQFHRAASTAITRPPVFSITLLVSRNRHFSISICRKMADPRAGPRENCHVGKLRGVCWLSFFERGWYVRETEGTKVTRAGGWRGGGRLIRNVDQIQSPIQRVIIQRW